MYPEETPELAAVLASLSSARIERADVGYKGTQLKALLVLDGGQKVVFKPRRLDSPKMGIARAFHASESRGLKSLCSPTPPQVQPRLRGGGRALRRLRPTQR